MPEWMNAGTLWFLAGAVLMLAEMAAPGFILLFFGLGAWITALSAWAGLAESLAAQLTVFLVSSLLSLILLRRYARGWFGGGTSRGDTSHLDGVPGRRALVVRDISPHAVGGKVELNGTLWNAEADMPVIAGTVVEIIGRDGLTLRVRPETN
jgi:inner membrane protein